MNEYDSSRMFDMVKSIGYERSNNLDEKIDCFVINTCHIREKATDKVFHEVGRLKKIHRGKSKPLMIISGCVAQAESENILRKDKFIDAVVGPQSYHQLNSIIKKLEDERKQINATDFETENKFEALINTKNFNNKVSSFLTIQEGCDKFCKFCVVPYTRGPECSRSFEDIILEAKKLVNNGVKEITLLGQNVNAYNSNGKKLSDLLKNLDNFTDLERIRYTSSHPCDMTIDLIEAHKECSKLMPLLHLPVQSGSDKILKLMNRKHTIKQYLKILEELKIARPGIKFTSDFIISYPNETYDDFQETINLMEKVKFINSYSFIYSDRPGTPATKLPSIDVKISKQKLIKFQRIANDIKLGYKKSLMKKKVKVLFENQIDNKSYFGRDEHYNSVIVNSADNVVGQIKEVCLNNFNLNTLFGELVNKRKNVAA